ncbi:MAG: winged helix-turn-helix domain-containing protein [Nanoarchaeota archaeon]
MNQKKRERTQIIHDILKAIKDKGNNVKPTHILYKSNLSHQMLQEYINELIEKNFMEENIDKKKIKHIL